MARKNRSLKEVSKHLREAVEKYGWKGTRPEIMENYNLDHQQVRNVINYTKESFAKDGMSWQFDHLIENKFILARKGDYTLHRHLFKCVALHASKSVKALDIPTMAAFHSSFITLKERARVGKELNKIADRVNDLASNVQWIEP